ncbi:hypothetical protein B296_00035461 [Ensete ventricosum]|uniref:Uncharacterized protein n=1 Tax=Ensete ventricosum TaxID=4639 RepID=A0A426YB18_ENSVE|nr:hypothetical protein B296_00035461 [Ensete ventricosum]
MAAGVAIPLRILPRLHTTHRHLSDLRKLIHPASHDCSSPRPVVALWPSAANEAEGHNISSSVIHSSAAHTRVKNAAHTAREEAPLVPPPLSHSILDPPPYFYVKITSQSNLVLRDPSLLLSPSVFAPFEAVFLRVPFFFSISQPCIATALFPLNEEEWTLTSHPWLAFSLSQHPALFQAFSASALHGGAEGGNDCVEEFLDSSGDHQLGEQFGGGYDSDLRSIAAGILRASPAEQPESASLAVADSGMFYFLRSSLP